MKKELIYITCDQWWDTDIDVIPNLSKYFKVEVIVVSRAKREHNKFPLKEVPNNVKLNSFYYGRESRLDIRMFLWSLYYGFYLLYKTHNKLSLWIYDGTYIHSFIFGLFVQKSLSIISFHDYKSHSGTGVFKPLQLQKMMLSLFKYFHFQSSSQEKIFKTEYPAKSSFSTIMPVKDYGKSKKKDRFFDNSLRTFLFFGNISSYKKPEMFIEAANRFHGKANFIMAGKCKNWNAYQKLISPENKMLCHIRFIKNEEIPDYFCQSDFLVLPYMDTTQSGPLLVAYNYNLPIIASNLSYFEELIDNGETGFLFESNNQSSLEAAIEKSINLTNSQYELMREAQARKTKRYQTSSNFGLSMNGFVGKSMKLN